MRTMYDSVNPENIPTSATLVAGYVDGLYRWSDADWARFPNSIHVRIACFASTNDGVVLDVETGDATPAQAPGWVQRRRAVGIDPTIYCNTTIWPQVVAAFINAGVPQPHYWIAAYPGIGPTLYAGSVAHQYADPGPYDLSVVADYWPGVDPIPAPNTPPVPHRKDSDVIEYLAALYRRFLGRTPTDDEVIYWGDYAGKNNLDMSGLRLAFLGARAEPGAVAVAYRDFLGRDPVQKETDAWVNAGLSIQAIRDAVATSAEAQARKGN